MSRKPNPITILWNGRKIKLKPEVSLGEVERLQEWINRVAEWKENQWWEKQYKKDKAGKL